MKKYTVAIIICIGVILGFLTGFYLYKINKINKNLNIANGTVDNEGTEFAKIDEKNIAQVNTKESKVSPNCILTIKKYYSNCNHIIQSSEVIEDETLVNLTNEEFAKKYQAWEVQKFTPNEITVYKEIDDFCNEHYVLKDEKGYIAIYKTDKNGNENLETLTDITIEYLPVSDIEKIKNGMKIYTKAELNKTIEDFE